MGHRSVHLAVALVALALGCDRAGVGPGAEPAPTNVVLVTFDALRADAVSFDEAPTARTPELAALAAEGVAFTQALTSFVGTTPSMPSLMTGLWPSFEGVSQWNGTPGTASGT